MSQKRLDEVFPVEVLVFLACSWRDCGLETNIFSPFLFSVPLFQSPADMTRKIHAGDEVIQVNHQTVVRSSIDIYSAVFSFLHSCQLLNRTTHALSPWSPGWLAAEEPRGQAQGGSQRCDADAEEETHGHHGVHPSPPQKHALETPSASSTG